MKAVFSRFLVFAMLGLCVIGVTSSVLAQQVPRPAPVAILLLDDFTGHPLGTVPDPQTGLEIFAHIQTLVAEKYELAVNDNVAQESQIDQTDFVQDLLEESLAFVEGFEFPETVSDLCIVYLPEFGVDGQGDYFARGAGPTSPYAHGILVSNTVIDAANRSSQHALTPMGVAGSGTYTIEATNINPAEEPTFPITVIEADTTDFDLSAVTAKIHSYVDDPNFSDYVWVINMSFAIVPCADLPDLAAYEAVVFAVDRIVPGLDPLRAELMKAAVDAAVTQIETSVNSGLGTCGFTLADDEEGLENGEQGASSLSGPVGESITDDSCTFIHDLYGPNILWVAAAGNTGIDYPYFPAAEPPVVSVSASFEDEPFLAALDRDCAQLLAAGGPCSNAGEVLMPGVINYMGEEYFGTLFAAPRLSLRLAAYMAQEGANVCDLLNDGWNNTRLAALPSLAPPSGRVCGELTTVARDIFQEPP